MFADGNFITLLDQFRDSMSKAVGNRNDASHGGTEIYLLRCRCDKKIVLSDLQEVRVMQLGLIQQLVCLLTYK